MSETSDQSGANSISNDNAKRILALLKKGEEKINFGSHRDVVLVLGNTGSGKTTFTHFIAGNNDVLFSSEVGEDSGEFIISDIDDKINFNTTVISKTTYPELSVDTDTKTAFVDCPGFNSNSEPYDIATSYFTKKVLDRVENVKIVLIVSYPSLRRGVNANDFLQLLQHVTILIKNIGKYVDSIALVATKVDNTFVMRQGVPVLRPDRAIIEQIAQFLQEVKASLKTMQNNETHTPEFKRVEHKVFYENATKLLNALLSKNGTEYTKIGIFRRPNEAGKLSHVELLQSGKKVLKTMLENLKYSFIEKSDIGYSASDKSKTLIRDLIGEIIANVTTDVALIAQSIVEFYKQLETKMYDDDMYALRDQLKNASFALKQIITIDESNDIDEMINEMCKNFTLMTVKVPKSYIYDIKNLIKFSLFLQEIYGHKIESFAWKRKKELEKAVKVVDNSFKWYSLLGLLHERFSEYDIQSNTSAYRIPKLLIENSDTKIENFNDFKTFFDEINNIEPWRTSYENIKDIYLDATKIRYFDRLINTTFNDSVIFTCIDNPERLQVTGEYVKLSQIVQNECYLRSKSVQIFAKHTVFVDTDLSKENDLSIIAPRWHIIGSPKISLDGTDGQPHSEGKAKDGICDGCNGEDGSPGNPGTSGGHFFGLGNEFKNAEKLIISANGGDGGMGQHGGNGERGARGADATKVENIDQTYHKIKLVCKPNTNQACQTVLDYKLTYQYHVSYSSLEYGEVNYKYDGSPGERGGNAGHGGAGGVGGEGGTITLIGSNGISASIRSGRLGSFGLHGNCGSGGEGGYSLDITYYNKFNSGTKYNYPSSKMTAKAPDGDSGTCLYESTAQNANNQGLRQPQKKVPLYPQSLTLSDYKIQLLKNLHNCISKRSSLKFYNELQNNDKLENFYDSSIVLRELEQILKDYHPNVSTTYKTLFQLLEKMTKSTNQTEDEKKMLQILRTIFAFKINNLKNNPEAYLPLNRQQYFNLMGRTDATEIQNYYTNLTKNRIENTDKFIQTQIFYALDDTIERMDNQIVKLSLKDTDEEFDNMLLKRKLFAGLEYLNKFLHLTISLAKAHLIIPNKMKLDSSFTFQTAEIPIGDEIVRKIRQDLYEFQLQIIFKINTIISIMSNERKALRAITDDDGIFDENCNRIHSVEGQLHSYVLNTVETFTADDEIKTALLRFDEVNLNLIKLLPNNENIYKIIKKFQNLMKLSQFDTKMYHNVKDEASIDRLVTSFDRILTETSPLDTAMDQLSRVIIPILKMVQADIGTDVYKPTNATKTTELIQNGLNKIKRDIFPVIEQSEVDEDVQIVYDYMEAAVDTINKIYETLDNHVQRVLENRLLDNVKDHSNVTQLDKHNIEMLLRADITAHEYHRTAETFKNYVYPLHTIHPSNATISSMPNLEQNVDNLKSAIATNVKSLESNLNTLLQSEEYLLQDYFNDTSNYGAFFVWKNQVYGNTISRFLRGKEIALRATAVENDLREMIKFDSINLGFRSSNDTLQQLLNDTLTNFSVRLTHSGNSYFKFCNRNHFFTSESIQFTYNLNQTGVQIEPILSPYTTWILKLDPIDVNAGFNILEPFRQQQIDLVLEGHARYINAQNQSICEKLLTGPNSTNYTSLMTNNTAKITSNDNSSDLNRKRRDVSSHWGNFMPSFKGNFAFLKSFNPFNYFIGANSQTDQSSSAKSLEWNTESSTTNSTVQFPSNLNHSLTLLDYLVRNVTKVKPYNATTTSNLGQVRVAVLEIIDRFETMLSALGSELDIPTSQLELDPIQLMSDLEKEIINGNPSTLIRVLRDSVSLDPRFKNRFDIKLAHMLDQMNADHSDQPSASYYTNDAEQFQNHQLQHAFNHHMEEDIFPAVENYNSSLLN